MVREHAQKSRRRVEDPTPDRARGQRCQLHRGRARRPYETIDGLDGCKRHGRITARGEKI